MRMFIVLALALSCVALAAGGCSDKEKTASTGGSGIVIGEGKDPQNLNTRVGESTSVGKVRVLVTALSVVAQPSLPDTVLSESVPPVLGEGQVFYQSRLRIDNNGSAPIRVDPNDFALGEGGSPLGIDPTRSGPLPRSLLHGSSLEVVLTFMAARAMEPELIYRPQWFNGSITFKGTQKPAGMAVLAAHARGSV